MYTDMPPSLRPLCVAQDMSAAIDTSRHLGNMTSVPVDATESVAVVSTFLMSSDDGVWWRWLIAGHLLRYGPGVCVCLATIGVMLSVVVWVRLQRHLPTTLLYLLIAMVLELLPVYMHCGSYTLKQVIPATFWTPCIEHGILI